MFSLFKKRPKGLDARQRALEVIKCIKHATGDLLPATNKFLDEYPEYQSNKNKIIYEIQWIPYVSALICICSSANFEAANETKNSLIDIFSNSSGSGQPLSEDLLKQINYRLSAYLGRFSESLRQRDEANANGIQMMKILYESISDCAHEGIYFFTDKEKDFLGQFDEEFNYKLEEREPFGMLEMHVRETLMNYYMAFLKYFEKFTFTQS